MNKDTAYYSKALQKSSNKYENKKWWQNKIYLLQNIFEVDKVAYQFYTIW